MSAAPQRFADADSCARTVADRLGGRIVLGLPLGVGKPVRFANAIYRLACADASIDLEIFTALTLTPPTAGNELAERLLAPVRERLYASQPAPEFEHDRRSGRLPPNVRVSEFFFMPGALLGVEGAQRDYVSCNYTQVVEALLQRRVNLIAQRVATRGGETGRLSLSSNPDVTLDLADALGPERERCLFVAETSSRLPYMRADAETDAGFFDALIDVPDEDYPAFPVLSRPVSLAAHAAALHVASLVPDGGTLQIGIGSMGDAVAHALRLRNEANDAFRDVLGALDAPPAAGADPARHLGAFDAGLFAASEVFSDGIAGLVEAGIVRRSVADTDGEAGHILEAAFFLGSSRFYDWLIGLPDGKRDALRMTRVSRVNQLYGDEFRRRAQRVKGRFINEAMLVTLTGAVVSDGLDDGRVVSGIGGQYNFFAMAHALPDGRAIIVLPATRTSGGKTRSNIVWEYAHASIPRHLRDIVVTEYGVADLRGCSDRDVIAALIGIADSRFQPALIGTAREAGKLEGGFRLDESRRNNLPETLLERMTKGERSKLFPWFPWGTDLGEAEAEIAVALDELKTRGQGPVQALATLVRGRRPDACARLGEIVERLSLKSVSGLRERIWRRALLDALAVTGDQRRPIVPTD